MYYLIGILATGKHITLATSDTLEELDQFIDSYWDCDPIECYTSNMPA